MRKVLRTMAMASLVAIQCGVGLACEYSPRAPRQSGDSITFRMLDRNAEALRFALYVLDEEGTLSGSGGLDARNEKVDWTMALTPEDIARLDAAIRSAGWLQGEVRGEPALASGPRVLAVSVRGPGSKQAFTIEASGDAYGPETSAVMKILGEFSSRRYSGKLNELPQAGDSLPGR